MILSSVIEIQYKRIFVGNLRAEKYNKQNKSKLLQKKVIEVLRSYNCNGALTHLKYIMIRS